MGAHAPQSFPLDKDYHWRCMLTMQSQFERASHNLNWAVTKCTEQSQTEPNSST